MRTRSGAAPSWLGSLASLPRVSAPPMAEVLEPEPATAERAAAQAVETPGWTAPEDAGPQVGASRGRGRCGPGRAG